MEDCISESEDEIPLGLNAVLKLLYQLKGSHRREIKRRSRLVSISIDRRDIPVLDPRKLPPTPSLSSTTDATESPWSIDDLPSSVYYLLSPERYEAPSPSEDLVQSIVRPHTKPLKTKNYAWVEVSVPKNSIFNPAYSGHTFARRKNILGYDVIGLSKVLRRFHKLDFPQRSVDDTPLEGTVETAPGIDTDPTLFDPDDLPLYHMETPKSSAVKYTVIATSRRAYCSHFVLSVLHFRNNDIGEYFVTPWQVVPFEDYEDPQEIAKENIENLSPRRQNHVAKKKVSATPRKKSKVTMEPFIVSDSDIEPSELSLPDDESSPESSYPDDEEDSCSESEHQPTIEIVSGDESVSYSSIMSSASESD